MEPPVSQTEPSCGDIGESPGPACPTPSGLFVLDAVPAPDGGAAHRVFRAGAAPGNDLPQFAWHEVLPEGGEGAPWGVFAGPGGDWALGAAGPGRQVAVDLGAGAAHPAPDAFIWDAALASASAGASETELRVFGRAGEWAPPEVRTYACGAGGLRRVGESQTPYAGADTEGALRRFLAELGSKEWVAVF